MIIIILKIALPVIFALLVLPMFIRFFIGRIILVLIKKRYLIQFNEDNLKEPNDLEAIKKTQNIILGNLRTPFLKEYDLKQELISIIISIQNCYLEEEKQELIFSFSLSELIKCYFLLMSDLNSIINNKFWFSFLKKRKISTLKKINRINGYYSYLYNKIPFLKVLRKGRITGKILRIILIPILGLPSILISLCISIVSLFITEIIWKYYYSVILIKCAYYSMILYGKKGSIVKRDIDGFSSSKIKKMAEEVEELIDLQNDECRSEFFEESFIQYQRILEEYDIAPEKDLDFNGIQYRFNKKRKILKRILKIPVKSAYHFNPFYNKSFSDKERILLMVKTIGTIYYRDQKNIYEQLRIIDLFEILFMFSILAYNKLLFSSIVLDNISVDFILKAKSINDEIITEVLKNKIPFIKRIYKSLNVAWRGKILYKAARSTNPVGLVVSLTAPVAVESVKMQLRDYIYHRAGRLTLYCFESNKLKKNIVFKIPEEY